MKARFRDLLAAEWIKLWSLRSISWALGVSTLIIIGMNVNASIADYSNWPTYGAGIKSIFIPIWAIRDAFTDPAGTALVLAASSIGAITIVGEYSSGLIRTTFTAVPARRSVIIAKVLVVTTVMTIYGTVIAGVSFWASQAILSGRNIGLSIDYPDALQAVAASALLPVVCALIGMGIGAIVRHSATTIVLATALLLLMPRLLDESRPWRAHLSHAMPLNAWDRLTDLSVHAANADPAASSPYPATISGSWIVFAVWPLVAAILAVIFIHRRDV